MNALMATTGERLAHKAAKKVLPKIGEQFLYFKAQAFESDRERYEGYIGERYLQLCRAGSVRDKDEQADAKVLTNIAVTQVLSREVLEHLEIPGLRALDRMHELEERPETPEDLGRYLVETVPHLKRQYEERRYHPAI